MTGINLIDPRGMTPMEWTQAYSIDLERFGSVPNLQSNEGWQGWGSALSLLASLSGIILPNPYEYSDWQEWAQRLNETLGSRP